MLKILIIGNESDSDPVAGAIIGNLPLMGYLLYLIGAEGGAAIFLGAIILWLLVNVTCGFFGLLDKLIIPVYFGMIFLNVYIVGAWVLGKL